MEVLVAEAQFSLWEGALDIPDDSWHAQLTLCEDDYKTMHGKKLVEWESDVALLAHADTTMWDSLKQPNAKTKPLSFDARHCS